jgi:hypothetical protein
MGIHITIYFFSKEVLDSLAVAFNVAAVSVLRKSGRNCKQFYSTNVAVIELLNVI